MIMIETMIKFWFTGWMGLLLYWLPLVICLIGYTMLTFKNYRTDLIEREKFRRFKEKRDSLPAEKIEDFIKFESARNTQEYIYHYSPTDRLGNVIGRGIVSVVPVVNLWCAVVDVSPDLFKHFFEKLEEVFDTPLVPK